MLLTSTKSSSNINQKPHDLTIEMSEKYLCGIQCKLTYQTISVKTLNDLK